MKYTENNKISLTVRENHIRLDKFLTMHLSKFSRTKAQKLIKGGKVIRNGKIITAPHHLLKLGNFVTVSEEKQENHLQKIKMSLNILYEDDDILVINKPAGLIVHPSSIESKQQTLVNGLLHYANTLSAISGSLKPGIVHRLDKDTSGVMVIAKNNTAHKSLACQFAERKVKKTYIALVKGHISPKKGAIEAPLKRDSSNPTKITISSGKSAKYAYTYYSVKKFYTDTTLLILKPITGRTHQIRVHLSAIGHPIIGDQKYGDKIINARFAKYGLNRQFLHAQSIEFQHPASLKVIKFQIDPPDELKNILSKNLKYY